MNLDYMTLAQYTRDEIDRLVRGHKITQQKKQTRQQSNQQSDPMRDSMHKRRLEALNGGE